MNTYRWIAQNGDGTYTVGEGDIEIAVCKHRDDAIWLKEAGYEPAAWLVTEYHINELQAESIQQLIDRAKHAHTADIKLRIEGQDEWYEADWLKHLARATPPQREEMQEPVAWMCPDDPERETAFSWQSGHCNNCGKQKVPVYTAPPQREWQGLTVEEAVAIYKTIQAESSELEFAKAIEAKLKEKNAL